MSLRALKRIYTLAPKRVEAIAATLPQIRLDVDGIGDKKSLVYSSSMDCTKKIDGLVMRTTPTNVSRIVMMLTTPHCSFKKSRAKMATNTGVEKIITEASPRGI